MIRAQLILILAVFLIGTCSAVIDCHADDLRKKMDENTQYHKELVKELVDTLKSSSHGTLTAVDLADVLRGAGDSYFVEQAEKYVQAVKKIYEFSFSLKYGSNMKNNWDKTYTTSKKILSITNIINQDCFNVTYSAIVDKSGNEARLVQKLLKAVLEMFIAETFLNEHFNHLQNPLTKI